MRRNLLIVFFSVVVAIGLCNSAAWASARRPFSAPFVIGHADVHNPGVMPPLRLLASASNGTGALALAWTYTPRHGTTGIELARRTPDGPLSRARTIFTADGLSGQPVLAMDAHGDTLVAFTVTSPKRVMVIDITASGNVGHATAIRTYGALSEMPALAETPAGSSTLVFDQDSSAGSPDRVLASTRAPGGQFSAATPISSAQYISGPPAVTVADDGTATAAWDVSVPAGIAVNPEAQVAVEATGGAFGTPSTPADCASFGIALAGDAQGDGLFNCQGSAVNFGYTELAAARTMAGGTFGTPAVLPLRWGEIDAATALGIGPDRQGLVAFANGDGDHAGRLRTATWAPAWAAPKLGRVITQAKPTARARFGGNAYPSTPAIAFVHDRPVVAWGEAQPENDGRDGSVPLAAVTPEFASGSTTSTIGPGRVLAHASYPAAEGALDAFLLVGGGSGRLYAAWLSGTTVYASRLISLR